MTAVLCDLRPMPAAGLRGARWIQTLAPRIPMGALVSRGDAETEESARDLGAIVLRAPFAAGEVRDASLAAVPAPAR